MNPTAANVNFADLEKILANMPQTGIGYRTNTTHQTQTNFGPQFDEMREKLESAENQVEVLTNTVGILRQELAANTKDFQNQLDDLKTALREITHAR